MSAAKVTTDHDEIRKWVEARGGRPAHVKRTGRGREPGILRIDYPGFSGQETLEPLSWADWFDAFEENDLAFVHQDAVRGAPKSRFSKLVARSGVATGQRVNGAKRTAAKRATRGATGTRRSAGGAVKRSTVKRGTAKRAAAKRPSARPLTKKRGAAKRATARPTTARKARTTRRTARAAPGRTGMAKRTTAKKRSAKAKAKKR